MYSVTVFKEHTFEYFICDLHKLQLFLVCRMLVGDSLLDYHLSVVESCAMSSSQPVGNSLAQCLDFALLPVPEAISR